MILYWDASITVYGSDEELYRFYDQYQELHYEWDSEMQRYRLTKPFIYFDEEYGKYVFLPIDYASDGATRALDINSIGWFVHDWLCDYGVWADGTLCTNWQASSVLSSILKSEGRWFRARTWFAATWMFGGGKARRNGMW